MFFLETSMWLHGATEIPKNVIEGPWRLMHILYTSTWSLWAMNINMKLLACESPPARNPEGHESYGNLCPQQGSVILPNVRSSFCLQELLQPQPAQGRSAMRLLWMNNHQGSRFLSPPAPLPPHTTLANTPSTITSGP